MENMKALTVRLNSELAEELETIAEIEGFPVSEEIRKAIAAHIEAKKRDKDFQARLKKSMERNRAVLDRLAKK